MHLSQSFQSRNNRYQKFKKPTTDSKQMNNQQQNNNQLIHPCILSNHFNLETTDNQTLKNQQKMVKKITNKKRIINPSNASSQ